MRKKRTTADALKVMNARWGKEPGWKEGAKEERRKLAIGYLIYQARTGHGLTQKDLARRAGTSQSAISRIEDADYTGLKVETLQRIAEALGLPLTVALGRNRVALEPVALQKA